MMTIGLWIGLYGILGAAAVLALTKLMAVLRKRIIWRYDGCDFDLYIRIESKILGVLTIALMSALWPVAYSFIAVRALIKYRKIRLEYERKKEEERIINEAIGKIRNKWLEEQRVAI